MYSFLLRNEFSLATRAIQMLSHMLKLIHILRDILCFFWWCYFGRCIKWVQESFPMGGDYSGLVVIYEQCVRTFWHSDRYKDDLRYLKVWLEYVGSFSNLVLIVPF
jgi:hypothetical protein